MKSPVRNTGILPARSGSTRRTGRRARRRRVRSRCSTCWRDQPLRTWYGPYGVDGRCTLATATTCPGAGATIGVEAVAVGRVQDREPRDHVGLGAGVPAEQVGEPAGVALGLLDADDVGAALLDDAGEPVQRLRAVVGDRAPVGRRQVVVVAAVEDVQRHHAQPDRGRDRLCGGRGGRSWGRDQGRQQGQDRQDGRTGRAHQPSMAPEPPFSHPREITGSVAPPPGARSTSRARARRCGRPRGAG